MERMKKTPPIVEIITSQDELAEALAGMLFRLIGQPGDNTFHVALSGGNTPRAIFAYLNSTYGRQLANKRLHLWWGDERCVPPSHDDSNYKWAWELWLNRLNLDQNQIHRICGENPPEQEAIRYANEIRQWVPVSNKLPEFDINILGLGEDGHTASIFPDQMQLLETDQWCEVAYHPQSGQKRITLTGRVLNNSKNVIFIATGAGKSKVVRQILDEQNPLYPASHVGSTSGNTIWFLDKAASSARQF